MITGNFANGEKGPTLVGNPISTIIPGNHILSGIMKKNLYNGIFFDENFEVEHNEAGILSMYNGGKHDNNYSQFIISLAPLPFLNGKNVAFAKVVDGLETLLQIEKMGSNSGIPKCSIKVSACGEVPEDKTHLYKHDDHEFDPLEGHHRRSI